MLEIILGVVFFTAIVIALVAVILGARSRLVASGSVQLIINDYRSVEAPVGGKLLGALARVNIFLPAACGGSGTCAQCRVRILEGGGALLPTEAAHISKREAAAGERLACQVAVKQDMRLQVPEHVFGVRKWQCTVRSNHNVATFIKELILELPEGDEVPFRAGGYIQIECPPHKVKFSDFDIDEQFRPDWDRYDLWRLESRVDESVTRAYSMAN
nr:NADH:ubiquinone reductase (Na(+)-transporting) subunit F [Pseudomonadales bacterium]NIX07322.1 NADH:ubiquinone reductase (Na(+)-transporting) subunit F [Pseudomonadales bacterium]